MKFLPLIGKRLKDDDVVDILECSDVKVIYDFDRSHENMADKYWAASEKDGFQLGFDENQILGVIFVYVAPIGGFTPVIPGECDIDFFASIKEAEAWATAQKVKTTKGGPTVFLEIEREWVRLEFSDHRIHYEFRSGALAMVTISRTE